MHTLTSLITEPVLATALFSNAREGVVVTDVEGRIIEVNPAFTRITGYTRDEVLGRTPRLLSSGGRRSTTVGQSGSFAALSTPEGLLSMI